MTPKYDSYHLQCGFTSSYFEVSLRAVITALNYAISRPIVLLPATLMAYINNSIALVASNICVCDVFITSHICVNRM